MYRNGFKLCSKEKGRDSGKCFSLIRINSKFDYEVILGDIIIHPNLIYNMSREDLELFLLRKLNKRRSFKFEYRPGFNDRLRICISVERNLDFQFLYQLGTWVISEVKPKIESMFPQFVSVFNEDVKSNLSNSNVICGNFKTEDSITDLKAS